MSLNKSNEQEELKKEAKRQYARERYRNTHTLKSKDDSILCEHCEGWYLPRNQFQHEQTKKHRHAYCTYRFNNPGKR